jgi:GntR family transcriptional repressor for pyruvate dehydrogenase complex
MSSYDQITPRLVADGEAGARLSDRVATELQRLILTEELAFGERLPTEPELCRLFGVSRTVVREAVRSLASKGLLEVRQGGGTTVRFPDVSQASELLTIMLRSSGGDFFRLVHEVRSLLEVEIAGLAAERRTEADLAVLERQLEQTREAALDHEGWARADVELHQTVAVATHNPLYPVLLNSMAEMMMELRITAARLAETPLRAQRYHERIVQEIRAGERTSARRAMREHMAEANATYRKARVVRAFDGA